MSAYTRRSRHWKMATIASAPLGPATLSIMAFKNDHRDRFMYVCGQVGANLSLSSLLSIFEDTRDELGDGAETVAAGFGDLTGALAEQIGDIEEWFGYATNSAGLAGQAASTARRRTEWTDLSVLIPFAARDLNGATLGLGNASFGAGVGITAQCGYISGQIETRNERGRAIDFGVERFCIIPGSHSLGLATPGLSMIGGPLLHVSTIDGPLTQRERPAANASTASAGPVATPIPATAAPAAGSPATRLPARTGISPPRRPERW